MPFTTTKNVQINDYKINDHVIDRVDEMRDLDVIMDRKLSFVPHIEYVSTKAAAVLQFIKRESHKLHPDVVKILYSSLVRSITVFACVIWSPRHDVYKRSMESIQKQIVMFLNNDHCNRSDNNYVLAPSMHRKMFQI